MRCIECDYILDGNESGRCPECGRVFDAGDAKTFRRPEAPNSRLAIMMLYLMMQTPAVVISLVHTQAYDPQYLQWSGFADLLRLVCGPCSGLAHHLNDPWSVVGLFVCTWTVLMLTVCFTRVRRAPYWAHFILALTFMTSGCCTAVYSGSYNT
jgi:hypothetical protein